MKAQAIFPQEGVTDENVLKPYGRSAVKVVSEKGLIFSIDSDALGPFMQDVRSSFNEPRTAEDFFILFVVA